MMIKQYLITYNLLSSLLWFTIFITNVKDIGGVILGYDTMYTNIKFMYPPHQWLIITQGLNTVLEILHSIIGITKSPVLITILQFFARDVIVFGVCYLLPQSPGNYSLAFPGLLVAWSTVEIIRYPYYTLKLANKPIPPLLNWLRYLAFIVLYPLGLCTEPWVIFKSLPVIDNAFHYYFFKFGLGLYLPGFYFLYTHMLKQRRKVLTSTKKSE